MSVYLAAFSCNGTETLSSSPYLAMVLQAWTTTAAAKEEEAVEVVEVVEDMPNRCEAPVQPNQLLSHPSMPLSPDRHFSLVL